jgi:hypothetical protein
MSDDSQEKTPFGDIRAEIGAIGGELAEMAALRWELARLELQADLSSAKRLAVAWLLAAVMAMAALPLGVVRLAEAMDGYRGIAHGDWLLIFAGGFLILAVLVAWAAWRRFRRRFIGLQETLEELREDMDWIRG